MKYFLLTLFTLSGLSLFAQDSGKVVYEEKMDLHRNLPPDREDMKDMIPQFNSSKWELYYTGDASVYKHQKEDEEQEVTREQGGARMSMRFGHDNRVVYKNFAEDKLIDSRDFMQKQFLITGETNNRKWKIGTKQKEILGHNCFEASFREDTATLVTAWFTPDIQLSNGPADYQGLPGLILQIDINDGLRQITATSIEPGTVEAGIIEAPSKGKEVTAEEFKKIREEKMKEMGFQGQGPGPQQHVIIMRQ